MKTIKSYTDLEQSRKLAEILPIESADMRYEKVCFDRPPEKCWYVKLSPPFKSDDIIPCWSLAALLEQLDDEFTDEEGNDYNLTIVKENLEYQLYYHDSWGQAEDIETDYHDDMVDACYELIIKLYKRNLL